MKIHLRKHLQAWLYWASRLVLGGVFIYAAILKMRAPQDFADSIASYHILPDPIINLWAFGLPLFELIGGLFLLTGYMCRIGLLSIMTMLLVFLGAILSALLRGLSINCGCFAGEPGSKVICGYLSREIWPSCFVPLLPIGIILIARPSQ